MILSVLFLQEHRGLLNIKYPIEVLLYFSWKYCIVIYYCFVLCDAAWNSHWLERYGADMECGLLLFIVKY